MLQDKKYKAHAGLSKKCKKTLAPFMWGKVCDNLVQRLLHLFWYVLKFSSPFPVPVSWVYRNPSKTD